MNGRKLTYIAAGSAFAVAAYFGWKLTSRTAYESAAYSVVQADGRFEVREYPDLLMVATEMQFASRGDDGSFMRLFGYISGANEGNQKISMTTPVFMDRQTEDQSAQMGFVLPEKMSKASVPRPERDDVEILTRRGGQFAVIRFSGRLNSGTLATAEQELLEWMSRQGYVANGNAESAGYDPPWTPGPFRRNELLIRLQ